MLDRVPTRPGRIKLTSEADGTSQYFTLERADEPSQEGTPLNKETLLSDATATAVANASGSDTPETVDDALKALSDSATIGKKNFYVFTSSTTWTVPKTGKAFIIAEGGGGGGGGNANCTDNYYPGTAGGGGGGSGFVNTAVTPLKAGDTLTIVCGAGGAAGQGATAASSQCYGTNGGAGGTTSVSKDGVNLVAATGGNYGERGYISGSTCVGGSGGSGGAGGGGGGAFIGATSSTYGSRSYTARGGNGGSGQYGGGGGGNAYARSYSSYSGNVSTGGNGGNSTVCGGGGGGGNARVSAGTTTSGKGGNSVNYSGGGSSTTSNNQTYGGNGASFNYAGVNGESRGVGSLSWDVRKIGNVTDQKTRIISELLGFNYGVEPYMHGIYVGTTYIGLTSGHGGSSPFGYYYFDVEYVGSSNSTAVQGGGGLGFGRYSVHNNQRGYFSTNPGLHGGSSGIEGESSYHAPGGSGGSGLFGRGSIGYYNTINYCGGGGGGFLDAPNGNSEIPESGTGEGGGGGVLICLIAD